MDTVGGVWTYALELAQALAPHNVEVALATMGAPLTKQQCREVRQVSNVNVFESGFKLEWMDDPWTDVEAAGAWLCDIEAQTHPDIIHLNGYVHGALPWRAPVLVAGHSCVLSWWRAVKHDRAPAGWETYRRAVARGLQAADLVVAPTQAMLDALHQHYGPLPRARVIANARQAAQFRPGPKEPFVLAAGRLWDEAKNIGALNKAAPHLPWPVFVAGDDQHPDGGQARHENVRLLGQLSPSVLADRLARAGIYALPARYEPFGLSALEAGLAGCALVLGDIPSLREVWGDAAVFVDPNDPDALQKTLTSLIRDDAKRAGLGDAARTRAGEYTPERMAAGYLAAYLQVKQNDREQ